MARYPHNISPSGFLALTWVGFGLATLFVAGRAWIRFRILDRFGWPDFWIFLAFVTLLTSAIIQTVFTPLLYDIVATNPNPATGPPHARTKKRLEFSKYVTVLTALFLITLWAVKAAFLALFNPLFDGMKTMKRWWKGVSVFTGLLFFSCLLPSLVISAISRHGSIENTKLAAKQGSEI